MAGVKIINSDEEIVLVANIDYHFMGKCCGFSVSIVRYARQI